MKELSELLEECVNLTNEIYNMAFAEEFHNVRDKSSLLINKLNKLLPDLLEYGLEINPILIQKTEKLVEAIDIGDCITTMDIVRFEMQPIFAEYLESIGESFGK